MTPGWSGVNKTVAVICQSAGLRLCSAQRNQPQRLLNAKTIRTGHALRLVPLCGTQPLSVPAALTSKSAALATPVSGGTPETTRETRVLPVQLRFTGSMSTASVTSSGSTSVAVILASAWLKRLIARVRSMIW